MSANLITLVRIVVAPFFAYSFIVGYRDAGASGWLVVSLLLLGIIELSDVLDGQVARSTKTVSDFGKFFDPMADSVSRLTIFAAFLRADAIPLWMFLIFLFRDTFVQGIRYLCIKQGTVVGARKSGKLKAIFQACGSTVVVVVPLLRRFCWDGIPAKIMGFDIGYFVMLFPALFTVYSGWDYWKGTRTIVREALKPLS